MKKRYPLIDLFKWIALGIMLFSHTIKFVAWEFWSEYLFWLTNALGFPLFGIAFAYTTKTGYRKGYPWNLVLWAIVAQIPFWFTFGHRLNILFAFCWALLPFPFNIFASLTLGQFTDWGILGSLMLCMARYAQLPEPPHIQLKVPRAKAYPIIYAAHVYILAIGAVIYYSHLAS
jgi:hypothetical protein